MKKWKFIVNDEVLTVNAIRLHTALYRVGKYLEDKGVTKTSQIRIAMNYGFKKK